MDNNVCLTSGQLGSLPRNPIPNPSWGMVFGLTLVVVLIGFFVMYLIFRMSKQEKMLDVISKRSQNIPTPDDVFGMIQQCYNSPQFQQPMMRNIHSMVETRLNDFDEYCRVKYGNTTDKDEQHSGDGQVYTSGTSDVTHDHPPPLEDQQRQIPPQQSQLPQQPPLLSAPSGPQPFPPPQPSSNPPSNSGGGSILAEALPSLLTSLLSGGLGNGRSGSGNSASGDVTFPVIIGDIMTLMSNQRARQQRREEMAPSSNVTDSASPVEFSNPPNNA